MAPGFSGRERGGEKSSHREKGGEKGGSSEQWSGGGEWTEKGAKGASRGGKGGGKSKGRNGGKGGDAGRPQREKQDRSNPEGLQSQLRPQDVVLPPPPPKRPGDSSKGAEAPPASLPAAAQATPEGDVAAQTRAKDEVFAEIRRVLEGTTNLQQADFDFRVRQHLHALYNQGGKERLREGMGMLQAATATKDRQAIKKWPAYLVTLLRRFDSDQASQDREARARARVAAAAAATNDEPASELKALPLDVMTQVPQGGPVAANDDPFNFDSPVGGTGGSEPWAAWGMPQPSSPVAAR